ncbi:MAG: hypothetical protein II100_06295 [Prevotella sp.]|nr:hypothetical protein [Prevotella sp.]
MGEIKNADRHLIIVASYAETPIGVSKWLVTNDIYIFPCCYARDIMKHVANLKAGNSFYPYPYQPFRRTYRHGCIAGYHCQMPIGISSFSHRLQMSIL